MSTPARSILDAPVVQAAPTDLKVLVRRVAEFLQAPPDEEQVHRDRLARALDALDNR